MFDALRTLDEVALSLQPEGSGLRLTTRQRSARRGSIPGMSAKLAEKAAMSPRHFARAFTAEKAVTPAKAVERLRLEAARTAVETGRDPIDRVAEAAGFGDPERMRRAFLRAFGQPPQALRRAARA